jgi:hypothetical protein
MFKTEMRVEKKPKAAHDPVVVHGGSFAWHDNRQDLDIFVALCEYPKGFLVRNSTSLGNGGPSFRRYIRKAGDAVQ